mmetsp:Transcript_32833/g.49524  ORF Transcript_32833/g.49524 Transcript_32833/m.49524 type:complete len:535 (+) Transcript_32833:107-1711(+)
MCRDWESSEPSWCEHAVSELKVQLKTSFPAMTGMLINKFPWMISIGFAGKLGSKELAAAALATTICNVTGLSLSVGLSTAMATLTAQGRGVQAKLDSAQNQDEENTPLVNTEKGEKNYHTNQDSSGIKKDEEMPLLPLVYFYRGTFIQLLLVIPVAVWWLIGVKSTLLALGQGPELSEMTQDYLRILSPGLLAWSINWTFTTWLQSLEMADIPAYAASIALVVHIPLNILFIHVCNWGYLGVATATVLQQTIQPIYVIYYTFITMRGRRRILENIKAPTGQTLSLWREASLALFSPSGILQYLSLALPGIVIISEWWASELMIFLSGTLVPHPDIAVASIAIYQTLNTFCFMLPVGCSIAGSARIGTSLGSGDVVGADLAAKVSVGSGLILSVLMGSILFLTPHHIFPSLFSPDNAVVNQTSRLIPLLSVYVVGDGIQSTLNGIIKGCGRQCLIMPIVITAYWIIGVPLGYYFAFIRHDGIMCEDSLECGVTGLVSGLTVGTWIHLLLLAIVVIGTTNWNMEAQKARERNRLKE